MTGIPILPAPIVSLSDDRIITVTRSRAWGFSLLTGELQDYPPLR